MDFEEFFKKKRIDLIALQGAEPVLFSEFKLHYTEMGEKSFDHTKKYWFNKIRRQFPLAVEIKIEKVKIDNPLAEQTITESLIDAKPAPKLGFVPKFKAANIAKPEADQLKENAEENKAPETPAVATPKPGFTPRFKAANMLKPAPEPIPEVKAPEEDTDTPPPTENPAPKPAYKPRFNMKNLPKKDEE